jgi:digeranylgeranylglycerophospholipid reductase
MTEKFDAIVVGAGPAGSTTAKYAAESGASVLLIDKRKEIGVPVQCGEFMPDNRELGDMLPAVKEIDELFDMGDIEPLIQKRIRKIILISPRGREYTVDFAGYTVNRDRFDCMLSDLAEKDGTKLLTGTKFIRFSSKNRIITTRGAFDAKVIVAADGPHSAVCRETGFPEIKTLTPALTCQAKGEFDDNLRMFFGKKVAPGGFAWIIPKNGCANVGLGIQKSKIPLHRLLGDFLDTHDLQTKKVNVGFVPISGPIDKTVNGNVLAVGDAAGQVMATNGGGIPIAMVCGRLAGAAIGRHIQNGEELGKYETKWRTSVGKELETAAKTKRLADRFFKADFLLEFAMKRLGEKGLERVIRCRKAF